MKTFYVGWLVGWLTSWLLGLRHLNTWRYPQINQLTNQPDIRFYCLSFYKKKKIFKLFFENEINAEVSVIIDSYYHWNIEFRYLYVLLTTRLYVSIKNTKKLYVYTQTLRHVQDAIQGQCQEEYSWFKFRVSFPPGCLPYQS